MISRRSFFAGLAPALVAAPAIIRTPGLLMPVKSLILDDKDEDMIYFTSGPWDRYSMPLAQWRWIFMETERNVQ